MAENANTGTDLLGILRDQRSNINTGNTLVESGNTINSNILTAINTLNNSINTLNAYVSNLNSNISGVYNASGYFRTVDIDKATEIIDLYIHSNKSAFTLSQNSAIDATGIYLTSMVAITGDTVCLKQNRRYYQGIVLNHTATRVRLDTPLDYAFTTSATGHVGDHDMSVNGSVTPQIFHIKPPFGVTWNVTRIIIHIEDNVAMDDGTFGGISALTNGVVLRVKNGVYKNIFNVKTNGEMAERAYDREYATKPPAGTGYAVTVRRSFNGKDKQGTVIKLNGDTSDELQVIIQDDLSGLNHFHMVCQGNVSLV